VIFLSFKYLLPSIVSVMSPCSLFSSTLESSSFTRNEGGWCTRQVSNTVTIQADVTRPTVTLSTATILDPSGNEPYPLVRSAANSPFVVTATFSEPVMNFVLGDFEIDNGVLTTLNTTDDTVWYTWLDPTDDGDIFVHIPDGVIDDYAENTNEISNTLHFDYDNFPPTMTIDKPAEVATNASPYSINITSQEGIFGLTSADVNVDHPTAYRYWRLASSADAATAWRVKSPIVMYNSSVDRTWYSLVDQVQTGGVGHAFASSSTRNLPEYAFYGTGTAEWEEFPQDSEGTVTTVTTNSAGTDLVGMAVSFDYLTVYVADSLDCSIRAIDVATGAVTFIVGSGCATGAGVDEYTTRAAFMSLKGMVTAPYGDIHHGGMQEGNDQTTGLARTIELHFVSLHWNLWLAVMPRLQLTRLPPSMIRTPATHGFGASA